MDDKAPHRDEVELEKAFQVSRYTALYTLVGKCPKVIEQKVGDDGELHGDAICQQHIQTNHLPEEAHASDVDDGASDPDYQVFDKRRVVEDIILVKLDAS